MKDLFTTDASPQWNALGAGWLGLKLPEKHSTGAPTAMLEAIKAARADAKEDVNKHAQHCYHCVHPPSQNGPDSQASEFGIAVAAAVGHSLGIWQSDDTKGRASTSSYIPRTTPLSVSRVLCVPVSSQRMAPGLRCHDTAFEL